MLFFSPNTSGFWSAPARLLFLGLLLCHAMACGPEAAEETWQVVTTTRASALTAVHGTSARDVWMVGADDGQGPLVLHFDGEEWKRSDPGVRGDFWWVHAFDEEYALFGGSDGNIVLYDGEEFARQKTPGLGKDTVFGIWGTHPDDVYAVGGSGGRNGFIWHFDGSAWSDVPLPADVPTDAMGDVPPLFKVSGHSNQDVWIVGDRGVLLRGNAKSGFRLVDTGSDDRLFTVHCGDAEALVVGGSKEGVFLQSREPGDGLSSGTIEGVDLLQGAFVQSAGTAWVTGRDGKVYRSESSRFERVEHGLDLDAESLHAVWVDPSGGVWAVGGNVVSGTMDAGVAIHRGSAIAAYEDPTPITPPPAECPDEAIDPEPMASMARRWNEQLLNAIRRDLPRPTVHARNLHHLSVAMWDAWATYQADKSGVVSREKLEAADAPSAVDEAIAHASYRVLSHRYGDAVGGDVSQACFDAFFEKLGYDAANRQVEGEEPRAVGNRTAERIIAHFRDDGANEGNDYRDPAEYKPDVPPMIVDEPGTATDDPLAWQQIILAEAVTQNGILEGTGLREPVGTHWGEVEPFALVRAQPGEPYYEGQMPPTAVDEALMDAVVDVIRKSAELDIKDGATMDISPGSYGNNPLGTNDGGGHSANPVTGLAYDPHVVPRGDFVRVLAEFWADGPESETPPGHWNTLFNEVSESPHTTRRLFGTGEGLDPLAWDVHGYLALNGALHDAAIASWELKRYHTSSRPITLIRYFGALGQSSEPGGPSYHPDGLPLIDGIIEVVTEESSAAGQRHDHLARYLGEVVLWSWRGEPGDRQNDIGGVDWVRAVDWLPYQRRTFVTPAFPGYVSGHSTFSRAAAEVLAGLTGDPFFPGGMGSATFEPGYLVFESGPTEPIDLQWGTYFDAADQAGQSRLWGGIHILHDDLDGRVIGASVGKDALALATQYFDGSAP